MADLSRNINILSLSYKHVLSFYMKIIEIVLINCTHNVVATVNHVFFCEGDWLCTVVVLCRLGLGITSTGRLGE